MLGKQKFLELEHGERVSMARDEARGGQPGPNHSACVCTYVFESRVCGGCELHSGICTPGDRKLLLSFCEAVGLASPPVFP